MRRTSGAVLQQPRGWLREDTLVVSIIAGVGPRTLCSDALGPEALTMR
ncbi:MAG TPA: hypothetical protein VEZ71_12540 [Archangium sp.]|nr:hypothetical protein [Archangium sp.]